MDFINSEILFSENRKNVFNSDSIYELMIHSIKGKQVNKLFF